MPMEPFANFPRGLARSIRFVLTDVDDTLTANGRLAAATYAALEDLQSAGIKVVPVTAAPAGWCDGMARMWPVAAMIAENGGLCFVPDPRSGEPLRRYWLPPKERIAAKRRQRALANRLWAEVRRARLADDQAYRETTLAIAVGDVPDRAAVTKQLIAVIEAEGAQATENSLWVLGWYGGFDKLAMARRMAGEILGAELEATRDEVLYIGDSLNDEPMFRFFPHSVGVSTVVRYVDALSAPPRWITAGAGGAGFVEMTRALLAAR